GLPVAAGVYLAATRLLLPPAAAPEIVTTPEATLPVTGSAATVTPAGRETCRSMPPMLADVPEVPSLISPPVGLATVTGAAAPPLPPLHPDIAAAAANRAAISGKISSCPTVRNFTGKSLFVVMAISSCHMRVT